MVLRLMNNIHAVPHSFFDMVGSPVICASHYDICFVSLDSAPLLETIDEFIIGHFLFIGVILGDEDCTAALGIHVLHECGLCENLRVARMDLLPILLLDHVVVLGASMR